MLMCVGGWGEGGGGGGGEGRSGGDSSPRCVMINTVRLESPMNIR